MRPTKRRPLSARAREVLRSIVEHRDREGAPPRLSDIPRGEMPSTVASIHVLVERGLVRVVDGRLVPTDDGRKLFGRSR